jgi:hypothetical protein
VTFSVKCSTIASASFLSHSGPANSYTTFHRMAASRLPLHRMREGYDSGGVGDRMRARRLVVAVVALVLLGTVHESATAQGDAFMVYGPIKTSCGTFTASSGATRHALEWWLQGFVSGVNYARVGGRGPVLANTDPGGVAAWVAKYCADRPLELLPTAAISLVEELEGRARSAK